MGDHQRIATALADGGMRRAVVVPSIHNLALLEAVEGAGIECLPARSELGAAHMADGHARVSGAPTGLITSTGPGAGNAVGGFAAAAKDGSAVVHLSTTNFPGHQTVAGVHGLHTVAEQSLWTACDAPVLDFGAGDALPVVADLIARRRPFSIIVPTSADRAGACMPVERSPSIAEDDDRVVDDALRPWLDADRRLLWIGGGARAVGVDGLVELAERTAAAVVTSVQGKDLFPPRHPQFVGCTWNGPEVREAVGGADACLVLGSRLSEISTGVWAAPFPALVVDVGLGERGHLFADTRTLRVSARSERAAERLGALGAGGAPDWAVSVAATAARRKGERGRDHLAGRLLGGVEEGLTDGDVVVGDMTKLSFHVVVGLRLPPSARFLFPGLLNMGFGLPAALGASIAAPDRHVVAIIGDGSLLSVLSELDHLRAWAGRLTVVLVDSDGYGLLESRVAQPLADRTCRFPGPDWAELAGAFGVEFHDVTPQTLGGVLRDRTSGAAIVRLDASGIDTDWRLS